MSQQESVHTTRAVESTTPRDSYEKKVQYKRMFKQETQHECKDRIPACTTSYRLLQVDSVIQLVLRFGNQEISENSSHFSLKSCAGFVILTSGFLCTQLCSLGQVLVVSISYSLHTHGEDELFTIRTHAMLDYLLK